MRKLNFCATQIKTVLCINKLRHIKHIVKSFLNKSTNTFQDNDIMRLNIGKNRKITSGMNS